MMDKERKRKVTTKGKERREENKRKVRAGEIKV